MTVLMHYPATIEYMQALVPDSLFGFLQESGLATSGGEAAALLMEGAVCVNHLAVRNPRKRLQAGDVVAVSGSRVVAVFGAKPLALKKSTQL
ncbi:RNA-binding S4 domain-containing protein [Rhodococcus artemisiae]|uniref:RNA-binding S4 domain-containing protein n=1 Tax=Rhodococcus artemisiae TaxID=714159 RepID=A0ABU7LDC7_9NOCA|nr:RNA-binding S4 domain-containing protein [Rhodococcus artemisiae]MEE2059539.1 RNA-binding S4 domain-containing protein [Rhodococcus artemisiae]